MRQVIILLLLTGTRSYDLADLEKFTPQVQTFESMVREKCVKSGAKQNQIAAVTNQPLELNSCLEPYISYTKLQVELDEAKKTGSMQDVFKQYCAKYPEIYKCLESVTDKMQPCLAPSERELVKKGLEFVGTLKKYMCFKDGNRMEIFISQGGMECLEAKQTQVQDCTNRTLGWKLSDFSLEELNLFNSTNCSTLLSFRSCIYSQLTQCQQNIPANVIDALFKFLQKEMSCGVIEQLSEEKSHDRTVRYTLVALILLGVAIICYKLAT